SLWQRLRPACPQGLPLTRAAPNVRGLDWRLNPPMLRTLGVAPDQGCSRGEMRPMFLKDQIALVTGAGRGIGRAAATALAQAGASVAVVDVDAGLADSVAASLAAHQHRTLPIVADVGDLANIERMVERTVAEYGRIDILVNNAGVTRR